MDKEYIDILNNYTGLSSVITVITRKQDEYILGELNNKIKIVMGLDIEPKKLEKWVKQSMFIETFNVEQLRGFATEKMVKNLLKTKDNTILELKDQLVLTEKALELACEEVSGFYCSDYCGTEKDCENCWYRDYYTAEHFKTKAKEMMSDNGEQV